MKAALWKVAGIFFLVLGVVSAVLLFWAKKKNSILGKELRVLKATADIKVLEERKKALDSRGEVDKAAIDKVGERLKQIAEERKSLKSVALHAKGRSVKEISDELSRLGY